MGRPSFFLFWLLLLHVALARDSPAKWQTLTGDAPAIIARGGFSGVFPDYTTPAYLFAGAMSMPDVVFFCDLQITKDGVPICRTDLRLDNSTNIADVYPDRQKTYTVNGKSVTGWFAVDFTADQILSNVTAMQNIYSRPNAFDGSYPVTTLEDVQGLKPPQLWLNVEYDMFFKQYKQDLGALIRDVAEQMPVNYVSSTEVGFLKSMNGKVRKTKLIFKLLEKDVVEPTTKQTYGSFIKDLSKIKSFCSGILVPKDYIWPVDAKQYIGLPSSLVQDAHELGLEIYAYTFANDLPGSYNYSYDPTAEYLQFIDNSDFSVDGILTDFPSTASEAVACMAHNKNNKSTPKDKPLVITHNGASGVFAACTDLAYQKAVEDGADIIDCSVQLTKDGIAFCLDSPDLMGSTTAVITFMSLSTTITEIQPNNGIFSFDLTWSQIQTLKPELKSPLPQADLPRNPAVKNQGNLMTLADFLEFANDNSVNGILINIENAAFLAKRGLDIVGSVSKALKSSSFAEQTNQQVLIQSDDTSVLSSFKQYSSYRRVLVIKETISDVPRPTVEEIKQFADAINIPRSSMVSSLGGFLVSNTDVVAKMQAADISVYISTLRNEYLTIAFDFFSDPILEIATYVSQMGVDGIVTEFPATATAYIRSPCYNFTTHEGYSILPVEAGSLLQMTAPGALPPAGAPAPALAVSDVVDPPLPPVSDRATAKLAMAPASPTDSSGLPSSETICSSALLLVLAITTLLLS